MKDWSFEILEMNVFFLYKKVYSEFWRMSDC